MFSGNFIMLPNGGTNQTINSTVNAQENSKILHMIEGQVYDPQYTIDLTDQLVFLQNETPPKELTRWKMKRIFSLPAANFFLARSALQASVRDYNLSFQGLSFEHLSNKKVRYESDLQVTVTMTGQVLLPNIWANQKLTAGSYLCLRYQDYPEVDLPKKYHLDPSKGPATFTSAGAPGARKHQLVPYVVPTGGAKPNDPMILVIGKVTNNVKKTSNEPSEAWGSDISLILNSQMINVYLFP